MDKNDRFGKEWSSGSAAQEYPTDQQAQQGLSFLGATPPSYNLHDAMFMACDWKDNWLFDQIKGVTDAYEQPLDLTVAGTRTALADAISFALVNQQVATEEKAGIAPIATQAETDAGTNDTKFITPLKLKAWVKQATETVMGLLKVATQAQVDTGTNDTTAVTPKKLRFGFSISLTDPGYIVFPTWLGGMIIQWGAVDTSSSEATATLPIAFPSKSIRAVATHSSSTGAVAVSVGSMTKTQITINMVTGANGTINYLVIGH